MAKSKECTKCKEIKSLELFSKNKSMKDGICSWCKECHKIAALLSQKKSNYKYQKKYHKESGKKFPERRKRHYQTIKDCPSFKLKRKIHGAINRGIKGGEINLNIQNILGCSKGDLIKHLQSKFKKGMTWENYGEWEIDHIKPMSLAFDLNDVKVLNHYTNLQPLWREENNLKGNTYEC